MSLFQTSVLKKHIKGLDKGAVDEAWERYSDHFHDTAIQLNIRNSKEEQYQEGFLRDLFVSVFNYVLNPATDFNLTTELKNVKGAKKTDGAILKDDKALAVIELKGTNTTDLAKVESQAFGYKNNQPGCVYVITSNFEKLRFYIDNAVDFEEFNLFQLSRERFEVLWLCLSSGYLLKNIPKQIKEESLTQEENVTKKLYKDYSLFRNEIFDSIQRNNSDYDKLTLFKKTQKLLDRFLFIFFAEDRLLLPPNSIREIINQWVDLRDKYDEYQPLYSRFKKYFGYMNTGYKGKKHDIFAYNGGLFASDDILDNIKIDDDLLYKHTQNLSNYDFESEVSVNILGHIFEHSLNEIEEIQAELEGVETDKGKSKRKKDGVFYTPKYITKYIVDNTVGKLCEEKKAELEIEEAEYEKGRKGRKKAILKTLVQKLEDYRNWLLELTICDPACGSGAFLNQALEFLISEHSYVDELNAKLLGEAMVLSEVENSILENNLFGVDINEESVDIAKLSLWLRTAQKGRKLTSLNNNIKCGNSLIDAPEVAGDKAFNWQKEFPEIFEKGGFDVIIGNPPYVRMQNIDKRYTDYYSIKYDSAFKNYDLYVLFAEKIEDLLDLNGLASYIMPNKFISTEYGEGLRDFISKKGFLNTYIDFSDFQVFNDATTYTGIFIFSKRKSDEFKYTKIKEESSKYLTNVVFESIPCSNLNSKNWIFLNEKSSSLITKISQGKKLKETDVNLFVGLQTSADPVFILEIIGDKLYSKFTKKLYDFKNCEIIKPLLKGAEIKRYSPPIPKFKLIFPYYVEDSDFTLIPESDMKIKYGNIWHYLNDCKEKLIGRENGKMDNERWYGYVYLKNMTEFEKPKILTQVLCKNSSLTIDKTNKFYFVGGGTAGGYGISINNHVNEFFLISILNSKLIQWFIQKIASPFQGGYFAYNKSTLGEIALPQTIPDTKLCEELVSKIIEINDQKNTELYKFQRTIQRKFELAKLTKKLQKWNQLSFTEFIKELKKNKVKLILTEEAEWEEYFESEKAKVKSLQFEVDRTDKEIDQMVYNLYKLVEEEIKIVEEAIK